MLSLQSRPTLCNPMDHNPPVSSVHEILQARILERVAMLCLPPWDLPDPGIKPASFMSSALAGGFFIPPVTTGKPFKARVGYKEELFHRNCCLCSSDSTVE